MMKTQLMTTFRLVVGVLLTAAALSGCSGCGEGDPGLCDDVTCEDGVCDANSGECINAADCAGSDDNCLAGFTCSNDICIAEVACNPDGTCDRGDCVAGACLNPDSCTTNSNCIDGYWCDGGSCVEDPCADVTCDGGVCQIGVGECVNADTCTSANEAEACLDGFRCVEGACTDETTFCDSLACDRGTCSFEDGACVNSDDCGGDDTNCLDGFFCDGTTCVENECEADMVMCDRGVCDPTTGDCLNAETCTAENECTDGFLCVTDSCVSADEACGMGGCEGNQTCEYDAANLSAACAESADGCQNALDCTGDRICTAGACADAEACTADALEPNNSAAEATDYAATAVNGAVSDLTICSGDEDLFTFDTTADGTTDGELVARVDLAPEDVGLGTIRLQLIGTDGSSVVGEATNIEGGVPTSSVSVTSTIDVFSGGEFTVRVAGDGDVGTAGVRYTLSVGVVQADVIATCEAPTELVSGVPQLGDTSTATGTTMASSCLSDSQLANDALFVINLSEEAYAEVQVTPQSNTEVAVSLRQACASDGSELDCAEDGSGTQSVAETLSAGTYYVLVEPVDPAEDATFVISYTASPLVCTDMDNSCVDASTASVCNNNRTGFDEVNCVAGCDAGSGACLRREGDVCTTAVVVDPTTGFSGQIGLGTLQNDYDPGDDPACVPDNSGSDVTDGEDGVFSVDVPDGQVLTVSALSSSSDDTAIYMVTDCSDLSGTCLGGANEFSFSSSNAELASWENTTGAMETVYVIIDQGDKESTVGITQVEINVATRVCTPGAKRCRLDRESQTCNSFGTGFTEVSVCSNGCDDATGECVVADNDSCATAEVLTSGVAATGDLALTTDVTDGAGCGTISTADGTAGDAVYLLQGLSAGDFVEVVVEPTDFDAVIYVADSCDAMGVLGECFDGVDESEADGAAETLQFVAEAGGDYFVVVDAGDDGQTTGTWTITATVTPPQCNAGDVIGCNTDNSGVTFCNEFNQTEDYTCGLAGCDTTTGNSCVDQNGDSCFDAITLDPTGGNLADESYPGTSDQLTPGGQAGSCAFAATMDGNENIYAIDLSAGDYLQVNFDEATTFSSYGSPYLLTDCFDVDSCVAGGQFGDANLDYLATASTTVYVVVDSDFTFGFDYSLSWTVTQPGWACIPDTRQCDGTNLVSVCSSDGLMQNFETCSTSCVDGRCTADPVGDTCSGAPDIGSGLSVVLDPNGFTNDVAFGSNNTCFDSFFGSDGIDVFYQATLQPYQTITVTSPSAVGIAYPFVYILSDCNDPTGSSCLAGDTASSNVEAEYSAGATVETVIVGLDADLTQSGPMLYEIEITDPECIPGAAPTCNMAGDSIEICQDTGQVLEYQCAGTCTNAQCDTPRGGACFDTIGISGTSGTVDGTWANDEDTVNPGGDTAACNFALNPDGADDIYEVALSAGDLLEVSVESDETTLEVYILETCTDTDTCLMTAQGDGAGEPAELKYLADTTAPVFLVVDRTDSDLDNTYTIDWSIRQATCIPDEWGCVDDTTVGLCNSMGSSFTTQYDCPGTCTAGGCDIDVAAADTCADAVNAGSGIRTVVDLTDATNSVELDSCLSSNDTDGPDRFLAVDLSANDILEVTADALGNAEVSAYVFRDCADPSGSCQEGFYDDSKRAFVSYQAPIDETVFVGIDDDFAGSNEGSVAVLVEVKTPDCDQATFTQACNADGDGFLFCDETGFTQTYFCSGAGTCDASTGRCDEPVGDVCLDPFDATPAAVGTPETFAGSFSGFSNDYDLGTGNSCTLSRTVGNEPVYVVDLTAGQTLTVDAVSTEATPEDIAIYATANCTNVRSQCLAGADSEGASATAETFTYTAAGDESIYIMVDSFYPDAAGAFDLTVTVN